MKKLFLIVIVVIIAIACFSKPSTKDPKAITATPAKAAKLESKPVAIAQAPAAAMPAVEEPADPYVELESYSRLADAKEFGKEALLKVLKHPHDANFPWFGVDVVFQRPVMKGIPPFYYVFGTVEAKNDFGAVLTKDFKVCVQANTSDKSLAIRFIEFDGKTAYRNEELFAAQSQQLSAAAKAEEREQKEKLRQLQAKLKAEKLAEQAKWAKEHPEEAARKKFGGMLANAKQLIKSKIYPPARKNLQTIIDQVQGTEIAQEAQDVLATVP